MLLEVTQGQWQECFWGKMVLEVETLASSGGRFRLTRLCALALGGSVQCGAHHCVSKVGIPVGNSLTFTEFPLPALLSVACVHSSVLCGWSCLPYHE